MIHRDNMSMIFGEIRITRKSIFIVFSSISMTYYTDVIQKLFYKNNKRRKYNMKISKEVLEKVLIAVTILAKAVQEHINNKENKRGE